MDIELVELNRESADQWDFLIENYQTKRPFHNLAWLEYLEKSQGGKKRFFQIKDAESVVGYFCGLEITKGPFKIFGSPLQGWNTPEMGPIINYCVDQEAIAKAISDYFKSNNFSVLEFSNIFMDSGALKLQRFDFYKRYTSQIDLSLQDEEKMWQHIGGNCRTSVRKALKNNLTVELAEDDDQDFIEGYYGQLKEVFRRRGLAVPYNKERVQILFDALKGKNKLFALSVKTKKKEAVATAIFIYDKKYIFLFGLASKTKYLKLSPNEFLLWASMKEAMSKNIKIYDFGGTGKGRLGWFKNKFNGARKEIIHWRKFFSFHARMAYFTYKTIQLARINLLNR